jgi:hypothetical protein
MNELLGSWMGDPLTSAGPSCREVANQVERNDKSPEPLLAGVFWWRFLDTGYFHRVVEALGATSSATPIVVGHAEGTRFDLLLLDPEYRADPVGTLLESKVLIDELEGQQVDSSVVERLAERVAEDGHVDVKSLQQSSSELAAAREFGVAVAHAPGEMDTCSLSPAIVFRDSDDIIRATLGTFVPDTKPTQATTADHAVPPETESVRILGLDAVVLRRHPQSDSCLLEIGSDVFDGRVKRGLRGPLRGTPPTHFEPVTFDGGRSGPTTTRVTGFDLSVIDPIPDEMSKVYTEPDTRPGDSGAALIDDNDRIIGFAGRRSRYDASTQFSVWVWAEQVYLAHELPMS